MNQAFVPLTTALTSLADAIIGISPTHQPTMLATHGWNQPALTLRDLAAFSTRLADEIQTFGANEVDDQDIALITDYAQRIEQYKASTFPQFWGGNGPPAITAYLETIHGIREGMRHLIHKNLRIDPRETAKLAKRISRMSAEIDDIIIDRETLVARVKQINDAYETAELLPESLDSLKESEIAVSKINKIAQLEATTIEKIRHEAHDAIDQLREFSEEASKLVAQCEEAYRITTSKGLAGAFDQRANGLTRSMQLWVLALVVALGLAAYFGGQRVALLSANLGVPDPKWGVIWLNFALSLLSVGAPLWFAWVATKQINQRFRLSEDYAFKASISKAYEGYRREAAKLDPEFSARLFSSSLTRLEEAPLRLIESTSHGSPLNEFLSSPKIQEAMSSFPEFKDRVIRLIEEMQNSVISKAEKTTQT